MACQPKSSDPQLIISDLSTDYVIIQNIAFWLVSPQKLPFHCKSQICTLIFEFFMDKAKKY